MRVAQPPKFQDPGRGAHGGLRVHRGLVQSTSSSFRPRLPLTDRLRKEAGAAPNIDQQQQSTAPPPLAAGKIKDNIITVASRGVSRSPESFEGHARECQRKQSARAQLSL